MNDERRDRGTGMVLTMVAFLLLATGMGLDGPEGILVTGAAVVMFAVSIVVQVCARGRDATPRED